LESAFKNLFCFAKKLHQKNAKKVGQIAAGAFYSKRGEKMRRRRKSATRRQTRKRAKGRK